MQTNPAVEQNKNIKWSESPWNQSGRKEKGLWRKWFAKEPSLKFRVKDWTSKRRCKWKILGLLFSTWLKNSTDDQTSSDKRLHEARGAAHKLSFWTLLATQCYALRLLHPDSELLYGHFRPRQLRSKKIFLQHGCREQIYLCTACAQGGSWPSNSWTETVILPTKLC